MSIDFNPSHPDSPAPKHDTSAPKGFPAHAGNVPVTHDESGCGDRRRHSFRLSRVHLCWGTPEEIATGLLGYIECVMNGVFELDCMTLRRTRDGRLAISYTKNHGGRRGSKYGFWTRDKRVHREIERQIVSALRWQGVLP